MEYFIAYDLGTGGIKASLYDAEGHGLHDVFSQYDIRYTGQLMHEQRPEDWWSGVVESTRALLTKTDVDPASVAAVALSGQSLAVVPVDERGNLLREYVPIWSDARAEAQANAFFTHIDETAWYMTTGNGFPPALYSLFKIMWYKENEPALYEKAYRILGSKDYCNLRMTGVFASDPSYASGSGAYDLLQCCYREDYIEAARVRRSLFPEIVPSHTPLGALTPEAARALGLTTRTQVIAGGVDNACMALGAKGVRNGRAYLSLGSSSWIAVTGEKPLLDPAVKPFIFAHCIDGMYASATSIFAAGSSIRWLRDTLCFDLVEREKAGEIADAYVAINELAARSPIGANGLSFNPSLAGGAMIEESPHIVGCFAGLRLAHTRADMLRAAMEGVTYNLYYAYTLLVGMQGDIPELLLTGGGSKSPFWRQMFADVFGIPMQKTNIDQSAASLGAAALCAYGLGYWKDYTRIDAIHISESVATPHADNTAAYRKQYELSRLVAHEMAELGDALHRMG